MNSLWLLSPLEFLCSSHSEKGICHGRCFKILGTSVSVFSFSNLLSLETRHQCFMCEVRNFVWSVLQKKEKITWYVCVSGGDKEANAVDKQAPSSLFISRWLLHQTREDKHIYQKRRKSISALINRFRFVWAVCYLLRSEWLLYKNR